MASAARAAALIIPAAPRHAGSSSSLPAGDDALVDTKGIDVICGFGDDDTLICGPGEDDMLGGTGLKALRNEPLKNDRDFDVHAISTSNIRAIERSNARFQTPNGPLGLAAEVV